MSALRLFGDRKSHSSRACLLLLQATKQPHEEVTLDLYRGGHWKHKEPPLPFKKVPVLYHNNFCLAESTSILRYLSQLTESGEPWYQGRDLQSKAKVDEFLDFWQSTAGPTTLRLFQNKMLYKMMFKFSEPDAKVVDGAVKAHEQQKKVVDEYFLAGKPFIGGDNASIADLLWVSTVEQIAVAGIDPSITQDHIGRLREAVGADIYDEVDKDTKKIPGILKKMKMI